FTRTIYALRRWSFMLRIVRSFAATARYCGVFSSPGRSPWISLALIPVAITPTVDLSPSCAVLLSAAFELVYANAVSAEMITTATSAVTISFVEREQVSAISASPPHIPASHKGGGKRAQHQRGIGSRTGHGGAGSHRKRDREGGSLSCSDCRGCGVVHIARSRNPDHMVACRKVHHGERGGTAEQVIDVRPCVCWRRGNRKASCRRDRCRDCARGCEGCRDRIYGVCLDVDRVQPVVVPGRGHLENMVA